MVLPGQRDKLWLCDCVGSRSEFENIYSLSVPRKLMLGCKLQKCWRLQRSLKTSLKPCKHVTDASLNLEGFLNIASPFLSSVVPIFSPVTI